MLKKYPTNSYLRGCIRSESKKYKKLVKSKHKQFINGLFENLDQLHKKSPRGYMELVKSMRDGSFDKNVENDTTYISPEGWWSHFSALLNPPPPPTMPEDILISNYMKENCEYGSPELNIKITKNEILKCISSLDNNKASSFDCVSNEMLKVSKNVLVQPLEILFNRILESGIYPSKWSKDILTPLHKSGDKNDANNYRGISVSSCLGKLFCKVLQKRLESYCSKNQIINDVQGSGRPGSRTADHLLIIRFLIDKYVKKQGNKLFACFVDLKKAYDFVPRNLLFHSLLKDYSIGGNFLKILQEIYSKNEVFIKTADGLLNPITTTLGLKQGCIFSPILFNIYINKIADIFDNSCDPVSINKTTTNCLLWADDLLLISKSEQGLQNAMNKMADFYSSLKLKININKTKVMIFNKRGLTLDKVYKFNINGQKVEVTDEYKYLGLKMRPSGSMQMAVQELNEKASRAWFGISHMIYKNKRLEVKRALDIFDSLVTPVALYASEFWVPLSISEKHLKCENNFLDAWEVFQCEKLNQKCCRMILSVHNKTSRLAVLGELARYPLFIKSVSQCLNYKLSLTSPAAKPTNLLKNALDEMKIMSEQGNDCWLLRVNRIESLLKIRKPNFYSKTSGKVISLALQSKFSIYWLKKVNEFKIRENDSINHNKLRTYSVFKGSFSTEPYLELIRNRNQRAFLTRLRVGSHSLAVELGRRTRPPTPVAQRVCTYCTTPPTLAGRTPITPPVDTEFHFLVECDRFSIKRNWLFGEISSLNPKFSSLSDEQKFQCLLCPISAQAIKLVNRFIESMFKERKKLDTEERNL